MQLTTTASWGSTCMYMGAYLVELQVNRKRDYTDLEVHTDGGPTMNT